MFKNGNHLYSSFEHGQEIRHNQYLLTVLSGSHGNGGHVSLWLEHFAQNTKPTAETRKFDLCSNGSDVEIVDSRAQNLVMGQNGLEVQNLLHGSGNGLPATDGSLAVSRHRSYVIDAQQRDRVIQAVVKFARKNNEGRYAYFKPGGGLGRIGYFGGKRGVNCADFVLKILNESGVGNRYSLLVNTPIRMSRPRN